MSAIGQHFKGADLKVEASKWCSKNVSNGDLARDTQNVEEISLVAAYNVI